MVEATTQQINTLQTPQTSNSLTSYSEALIRSDVFTSVLDFLGSENALKARKLSEKIAKIEAGNYFKNDFQEKLVIDLD